MLFKVEIHFQVGEEWTQLVSSYEMCQKYEEGFKKWDEEFGGSGRLLQ